MEIINEKVPKVFEGNKLTNILDFKKKVESSGLVSREEVMSLESLIEETPITDFMPLNGFTAHRSNVGLGKLITTLNTYSLKDEIISNEDIVSLIYRLRNQLSTLKSNINSLLSVGPDRLVALTDPKVLTGWDNDKIINLREKNLFLLLSDEDLCNRLELCTPRLNSFLNKEEFDPYATISKILNMLVAGKLSLYDFNKITYKEITYNDIIEIMDGTNSNIVSRLDNAYNNINALVKYDDLNNAWFLDINEEATILYKRLVAYNEYFDYNSDIGYAVLEAFAHHKDK